MELRTREAQRNLDTGSVTLRDIGHEIRDGKDDLRLEHIDKSKYIDIRNRTTGGAQKETDGRVTYAESRSPEIAYVLRVLPADLRKHWDSLTEMRQHEIIEKAIASASRRESGNILDNASQEKNYTRRYRNTQQEGGNKITDRSSQNEEQKTGNTPSKHNTGLRMPESGYDARIKERKKHARTRSYVGEQDPEIRDTEHHKGIEKETGNLRQTETGKGNRGRLLAVGREYGKRDSLKKKAAATDEKNGLRLVDRNVEEQAGLGTSGPGDEISAGFRTAETESGTVSSELRTMQSQNFQKSFSEGVLEKDPSEKIRKENSRKGKETGGSSESRGLDKKEGFQGGCSQDSARGNEERGDQRKNKAVSLETKEKIGQKMEAASGERKNLKEGNSSEIIQRESSGIRMSHRIKNAPEKAAPSYGKKNSAVRLIRRKGQDESTGKASRHFVSSFTNLVKADYVKTTQIAKEQRQIQIESSLQEYQDQTASRAVRIAITPLRIAAKKAVRAAAKKIAAGIASAAAAAINMLLPALVIILPILLIAGILPGLMGSLVAEEEEGGGESYNVSGGSIVEYARQWIGKTKYIYGAGRNGPLDWQDYADCSSFVHGVFSHFGVEIGWTTMEQENSGSKVCENSLSSAQPGDIVLFYDGGSIRAGGSGHVGIFSGAGNMVHNSSSSGTVIEAPVSYQNRPYVVRRITVPFKEDRSGGGGNATSGHRRDPTNYSQSQLELIWAIVAQEDNGSYKGALAVISSAMNRTESSKWGYCGKTAMEQLTAPGQYCYSNDTYWMARLGGNVPDYVKTAVNDCLKKGIRNHNHTSFRSTKGKVTGPDAVQIGGNWFFDY